MDYKRIFSNCEVKCGGQFKLQKEAVQIYNSNDKHGLSIGKTPTMTDRLLFTD